MSVWRRWLSPEMKGRLVNLGIVRWWYRWQMKNPTVKLSVELTTKCNASCMMCTRKNLVKSNKLAVGEMKPELVKLVLKEIKKLHQSGKKIVVTPMGLGEPLLYGGLLDFFRQVKAISPKIRLVLVTNGILLDKKWAKSLVDLGVDEICISLNATDSRSYRQMMGSDNFDRVVSNIEILIDYRNRQRKRGTAIFVQYLNFGQRTEKIKQAMEKWHKIMKYGDKCFVHGVVNQAGFYRGKTKTIKGNFPCSQPLWRMAVKINGDIYPCDPAFYAGKDKIKSLLLGNIADTGEKQGRRYRMMELMKKNDYRTLPECRQCTTRYLGINSFIKIGHRWY